MRILVTGSEGYLGSLLVPVLVDHGHEVVAVDTGFYKSGWLFNGSSVTAHTLNKDIRLMTRSDFTGLDAVVHMAELSNDPAGELAPQITFEINHKGSVRIAQLAKAAGVSRFIYMSSCSVYGAAASDCVTEESPLNPLTAYSTCKTLVERDLKPMADDNFSPIYLRNATAFGASPRMRFDIVLNNLAGLAWTTNKVEMVSDGTPWRPLVHALDIAKAVVSMLSAPKDVVHNEIFNVGDTKHNYRIREIGEIVADVFSCGALIFGAQCSDSRSYRVSFEKIKNLLGFSCEWDARRGAEQLRDVFQQINLTADMFDSRGFTRLRQLEYLLRSGQIDQRFFWRNVA